MVNQFILTTTDASARLGRFIISENLFTKLRKRRILTTMLILVPSWILAITNSYEVLWRLFGSSNQLIASITMITLASYFVSRKMNVKFIVIPAILVLTTTISALIYLTFRNGGYFQTGEYILAIISLGMVALGLMIAKEGLQKILKK